MSEWQSRATAPEDGSVVLGFQPDIEPNVATIRFDGVTMDDGKGGRRTAWQGWVIAHADEFKEFYPTHWMPLPNPPCDSITTRPTQD